MGGAQGLGSDCRVKDVAQTHQQGHPAHDPVGCCDHVEAAIAGGALFNIGQVDDGPLKVKNEGCRVVTGHGECALDRRFAGNLSVGQYEPGGDVRLSDCGAEYLVIIGNFTGRRLDLLEFGNIRPDFDDIAW